MLHAFAQNKSRRYERYKKNLRDEDEGRGTFEDEITAFVFGPLDFMPPQDVWLFWKHFLARPQPFASWKSMPNNSFHEDFAPDKCELLFWSRKGGVEPDLIIKFADESGRSFNLLVEVKWHSGLSNSTQLQDQWKTWVDKNVRENWLHVFIANDLSEVSGYSEDETWEPGRLRIAYWADVKNSAIDALKAETSASPGLHGWAKQVMTFLELIGIRNFLGFDEVKKLAKALPEINPQDGSFWQPFCGFNSLIDGFNFNVVEPVGFWKG